MAASTTLNAHQRRERARKAYLTGAYNAVVKAIVDRAPEITPEKAAKLRVLLDPR